MLLLSTQHRGNIMKFYQTLTIIIAIATNSLGAAHANFSIDSECNDNFKSDILAPERGGRGRVPKPGPLSGGSGGG